MKEGIILLAHGSKVASANQELENLVKELEEDLDGVVKEAYLQFAKPDFWASIREMLKLEVERITIIPLFILAGRHVKEDIPNLIQKAKEEFPQLEFKLTSHLTANKKGFKKLIKEKLIE